jgi:hypothetical protein
MNLMPVLMLLTMPVVSLSGDGGDTVSVPEHPAWWPGLYVRIGDTIVDAPEADQQVAMGYPSWEDRGELHDGRRMTLMAAPGPCLTDEVVRVIHVVESPEPGWLLYVMGPKQVFGEYLDGMPATDPVPGWGDPFIPEFYDGAVVESPAVDFNYDITSYRFDTPGMHEVQWIMDGWQSNVLTIEVVARESVAP